MLVFSWKNLLLFVHPQPPEGGFASIIAGPLFRAKVPFRGFRGNLFQKRHSNATKYQPGLMQSEDKGRLFTSSPQTGFRNPVRDRKIGCYHRTGGGRLGNKEEKCFCLSMTLLVFSLIPMRIRGLPSTFCKTSGKFIQRLLVDCSGCKVRQPDEVCKKNDTKKEGANNCHYSLKQAPQGPYPENKTMSTPLK